MTLEHIDPIYGRMDDAEQAIKDIQDLLVHLNADLSETQMFLARSAVWVAGQITLDLISNCHKADSKTKEQFIADQSAAINTLKTSPSNPLSVAEDFQLKCEAHLRKLGLDRIHF